MPESQNRSDILKEIETVRKKMDELACHIDSVKYASFLENPIKARTDLVSESEVRKKEFDKINDRVSSNQKKLNELSSSIRNTSSTANANRISNEMRNLSYEAEKNIHSLESITEKLSITQSKAAYYNNEPSCIEYTKLFVRHHDLQKKLGAANPEVDRSIEEVSNDTLRRENKKKEDEKIKEIEKKRREELIEANQKFFTDKEAQDRPRGLRYFHKVVHVGQAEKPAEEAGDDADAAVSLSSTHPGFSRLKPGGNEMVYRIQGKESDRVSIWFSEDSSKVILSKPPSFGSSNYDKQWGAVYDAYKLGGYASVEFDFPGREGKPLTKTQLQIIQEHQRMALERGLPLQLDGALLQAVFAVRENKGLFGNAKLAEAIYQQHVTNWPHNDTDKKKKKTQDDTNLAAYEIKLRDVTRDVTKANDAYQKAKVEADTLYGQFEEKKNDVELRQKYEVAKDTADKARETLNKAIVTAEKAFAGVKKEVEEQGVDVEGAKGYKKVIEEKQKEIERVKTALANDTEINRDNLKQLDDTVKTAAKSAELGMKSPDERLREKSDAFHAAIESYREAPTKESVQVISDAVAALRGEAMKGDVKDAALTALKDKIDGAVRAVNTLEVPRDAEVRKAFDVMQTQVQYTDDVVKLSAGGMLAQIQRETKLVELRRGLIGDITDDNGMKFGEVRGELDRLRDKQREVAQDRKAYLERCEQLLDAGAEPASLKDYAKRMEQFKQHEEVLKSGVRGMEDVIVAERDKEPVSATPAQNTWAHLLDEHDKYKKTMAERAKADDARLAERGAKSLQERMDERMKFSLGITPGK